MGLECSGDVSDVTFYELAEKGFVLCEEFILLYNIEFYFRFRDDILVILGGDMDSRRGLFDEFKRRSKCFKLKVESISPSAAVMLDLNLFKGPRFAKSGILDVSMFSKSTAQGISLSCQSWHQPTVHTSWPYSRVAHYFNCCSSRSTFRSAVLALFTKISSSCPDHPCLADLADSIASGSFRSSGVRQQRICKSKVTRIVLPYHPCFRHANSRLRTLHDDFVASGFGDLVPVVSYRNGGIGLDHLILADSKRKLVARVPGGA